MRPLSKASLHQEERRDLPFFFAHYSEIHVLDLRYFRRSVREYAEANAIDDILINYSLSTFLSDPSVFLLGN